MDQISFGFYRCCLWPVFALHQKKKTKMPLNVANFMKSNKNLLKNITPLIPVTKFIYEFMEKIFSGFINGFLKKKLPPD